MITLELGYLETRIYSVLLYDAFYWLRSAFPQEIPEDILNTDLVCACQMQRLEDCFLELTGCLDSELL